jgi:hypothetical protein
MTQHSDDPIKALKPFVGDWRMEATFPGAPPMDLGARATFEWLPDGRFLLERWELPVPEAPDGLAILGYHEDRGTCLQHYFDSRGVARVYEMSLADGVWTLSRTEPDFSSLEFSQRWTGTISPDGDTITGRREICHDGSTWETDFDLRYERVKG